MNVYKISLAEKDEQIANIENETRRMSDMLKSLAAQESENLGGNGEDLEFQKLNETNC